MYPSETFGFAIARPLSEVYEFLLEPTNFARWAFVGDVRMRHLLGRRWAVETSVGPRIIEFAQRNGFGVLDHGILRHEGDAPHSVGMWVVENAAGTELVYTSFQRPGQSDIEWESAKNWVVADLLALQSLLDSAGAVAPLHEARVLGLDIARPVREVYDYLAAPDNFAKWAFAGDARMEPVGDREWAVETTVGSRVIRFGERNAFGILSYTARVNGAAHAHPIPMRVFANGEGCQLTYVFYRRPGASDAEYASVVEWVTADLLALKSLLEAVPA